MVTRRIKPPYPTVAKRRGLQGQVKVRFLVDDQGRLSRLQILQAQPPGIFEETVQRTLPQWRFKPAVKQGRTVEAWVVTTIRFQLQD